jgi:hypothetical protein
MIGFLIGIGLSVSATCLFLVLQSIDQSKHNTMVQYRKRSEPLAPTAEQLKIPDHPTYSAGMPSPDERPDLYLKCEGPRYTGKVSEASKSRVIKFD